MNVTAKLILAFSILTMTAVSQASTITEEIDQQVWKPFAESWKTMDADKNIALHSTEVVRVMSRMKIIQAGSEYLSELKRMMGSMKSKGVTSNLNFRFSSRIQSADLAMDKGIYRAEMYHPERGKMINYAEFNVLLKKIEGSWKIVFDQDIPSTESAYNQLVE